MNEPQKMQIVKSNRDAFMDLASLAGFGGMMYFMLNPEKYDRFTNSIQSKVNAVMHRVSVMQARFAIRSLPETDNCE